MILHHYIKKGAVTFGEQPLKPSRTEKYVDKS